MSIVFRLVLSFSAFGFFHSYPALSANPAPEAGACLRYHVKAVLDEYLKTEAKFHVMHYLTDAERKNIELKADQLLFYAKDETVPHSPDPVEDIFYIVMSAEGKIYALKTLEDPRMKRIHGKLWNHTTLLAGQPVAFAGEISFQLGRPTFLSNGSGHYLPTEDMLLSFLEVLYRGKVDLSETKINVTHYGEISEEFIRRLEAFGARRKNLSFRKVSPKNK